jgi:hypothetical protein
MATAYDQLVAQLYQEQLGRQADTGGAEYFANLLASGVSEADVARQMSQSLEGQNLLTQAITSAYRGDLQRNPEQSGYQYWQSAAQEAGMSAKEIQDAIKAAAVAEQQQRGITGGFTNLQSAALEADPYGGRYATQSIYDLLPNAVNTSTIGGRQAQFVAPPTQQMATSQLQDGVYTAQQGLDVLNQPAVQAAISRALASGTMTQTEVAGLTRDLTNAKNVNDMYAAFNKPQGQVVIDALYGQQTGEAKTLADAQAEALQRQAVLSATDKGYYQNNMQLADAYKAAGLNYPFGAEAYQGYDTRVDQSNVINQQNFGKQINKLVSGLTQQFGQPTNSSTLATPLTGQYYSETGLQPGYTPVGTPGTTFRSGVAGYMPQAQLPTGFNFGTPLVNTAFQPYQPGAFQPEGTKTGGFITGFNADGTPIYSTYADPNKNVGGVTSVLNPYNSQAIFEEMLAKATAKTLAQQADVNGGNGG